MNRLEVDDRKGLEVAILSTLFSILNGEKLDTFTRPETTGEAGAALTPGQGLPSSNSPSPRPGNRRALSDEVETVRVATIFFLKKGATIYAMPLLTSLIHFRRYRRMKF